MWKILDLAGDDYFLHVDHNCLAVKKDGKTVVTSSFTDIHSILCHGGRITYSDEFIRKCIESNIPLIFCDAVHVPCGMVLPVFQHGDTAERFNLQIQASQAQKKQAWKCIIQEKLYNQSQHLHVHGFLREAETLNALSKKVHSGDTLNYEAQGAQIYFSKIYGPHFSRKEESFVNALLNYGYTIIRSCVARAVVSMGLAPVFGIFHSNKHNPYCLVDDLMEPLRPLADMYVSKILELPHTQDSITPSLKKILIGLTKHSVTFGEQKQELTFAIQNYVRSYILYLERKETSIVFPKFTYDFSI